MPTSCVIGLLWGDEGKGKIIDLFAEEADLVVRYGGGHNAGHTLVHEGERLVLHLIPSAIRHPRAVNVIGNGVVVDPFHLREEVERVRARGLNVVLGRNLVIAAGAHLILPLHRALDLAAETNRGDAKIGTTGRGIGPAYADRAARCGIRVGDLVRPRRLREGVARLCGEKNPILRASDLPEVEPLAIERELAEIGAWLTPAIVDAGELLRAALAEGKRILFEGAQGVLLDVDHGTYPYVTSSNASTGGIPSGTGLPPHAVDAVTGVVKAYATRVGSGPFPTELFDDTGERLRTAGHEFGSTTGRPRRCGWFDMVAVRYSVAVSGATEIALTNLDVLSGFDEIGVAVAYQLPDGSRTDRFPVFDVDRVKPIFEHLPGFAEDISAVRSFDDLPGNARAYVDALESWVGAPITTISIGPARDQVIRR